MGDVEQITAELEKFCSTQEKQSQEFGEAIESPTQKLNNVLLWKYQ